jgi:hypothetical protein
MKRYRRLERLLIPAALMVGFIGGQGCFLFPPSANFGVTASINTTTAAVGDRVVIHVTLTCGYNFDQTVFINVRVPSGFDLGLGIVGTAQPCGGDIDRLRTYDIDVEVGVGGVSAGTHTFRVVASQGDEDHDASVTLTVGEDNEPPTVAIHSPGAVVFGSPVTLTGQVSDNGAVTWVTRSLDGGTEDAISWNRTSGTYSTQFPVTPGPHTLVIRAYDASDNVGSATLEFVYDAVGNDPPVVSISSPAEGTVYLTSETVTLVGSATDTEDGTLPGSALVWTSNADGELGFGPEISVMGLSVGNHTITLTATDSQGASATATVTIHVTEPGSGPCSLFTFVLAPDELSVPIGGSNATAITLVRSAGFTAPITWTLNSASGASLDVIFEMRDFEPPVSTGTTTTLTLSPGVEASAGATFQVVVTGASEVPAATCTQPLTVTFVTP